MFVVTGGAGFIGSHLVRGLNRRGADNIMIVDDANGSAKQRNLDGCHFRDMIPIAAFPSLLQNGKFRKSITTLFHQGAITDTLASDTSRLMVRNFEYSKELLNHAVTQRIPFVYASSAAVYGAGPMFSEDAVNEAPLNGYGWSKLYFDRYVRTILPAADSTVVGLRYFNVYGKNERHKGRMASMVFQAGQQVQRHGRVRLFAGTGGVADGEQRRDFVSVEDVVDVNLFFAMGNRKGGLYNVGTGCSRSFNEIAQIWISHLGTGEVAYFRMPDPIRETYQNLTQADLTKLRSAGYKKAFMSAEEGIAAMAADCPSSNRVEPLVASI